MTRALALPRSSFVLPIMALALAALAGCTEHVDGGNGGGGESSEGGGGSGGEGGGDPTISHECEEGETKQCNVQVTEGVDLYDYCLADEQGNTHWSGGCNTPLVLSLDGAPVEYLADATHGFDVNGGQSLITDWPTARTPWLAIDRNGDGRIADGTELFGSMSPLASGRRAENGFVALRELDDNHDGRIDQSDPSFVKLLVWSDRDGDRQSAGSEIAAASSWGLVSIELGYAVEPRCDARHNCEVERAAMRFRDAAGIERTGVVIDVHLAAQR
ncbi:hemolysin-type calcium binding protein [Minicystis rosea]|nr:hemolysin-type calcium binding protein [Minicystis rosea]